MIPKHFSLVRETPDHYEIHDSRDGRRFPIAKRGLSLAMHGELSKIKRFDEGGEVAAGARQAFTGSSAVQDSSRQVLMEDYYKAHPDQRPQQKANGGEIQAEDSNEADDSPEPAPTPVNVTSLPQMPESTATRPPYVPDGSASPTAPAAVPGDGAPVPPGPPNPLVGSAEASNAGLGEQEGQVKSALGAENRVAANTAQAWTNANSELGKLKSPEQIMADHKSSNDKLLDAYMKKEVNPDHYWSSQTVPAKIAAGLGMILGGLGAAATGGHNMAMDVINKAIDRDMEAQKSGQEKAMNLWKMNREATQDELQANLMTRNQLLTAVEAKTKMFAASMGGPEAQLKFAPLLLDINRQKAENNFRLGLAQGGMSEMDPSQAVPILVKNPEQQKQVLEEIGHAQNVTVNKDKILQSFDQAAKENTVLRTGAGMARTPGSVLSLHQLMLPNFKQIDGTVRQAAMDESFHNLTPAPGDTDAKIQTKRQALLDWMTSEAAAPTAKAHGLDLTKFRSTAGNAPASQEIPRVTQDGRIALFDAKTKQFLRYQ